MAEYGETLSARELDVLGCIVNGASNKEAAAELHISQNTVKVHLRNIYTKLGVSSRTEAVTIALQQGILTIPGTDLAIKPEESEAPVTEPIVAPEPVEPVIDIEETAVSPPSPKPTTTNTTEPPSSRNWLAYGLVGAVVAIVLITAVYLISQTNNQANLTATTIPPTSMPFTEMPIGQTNWFASRPLTAPLADMAVASVGIDIYHIGGKTETSVSNLVQRFDSTSRNWYEMSEKPTAVSNTSAAVLFGEIYVPGGLTSDGEPTNSVEAYSPVNNAWRPIANLPKPISNGLALSNGGFLYVISGWDGDKYLDDVYLYDANNDSWRPLANLPMPLAGATGGVVAGELYIVGGTDGETTLDSCFTYNADEDTWRECPAMLSPRKDAGAAVVLNKLYVLGGSEPSDTDFLYSEFYDPSTQTWQVINTPMLEDATSWANMGVTNVETKIYVLGGNLDNAVSDGNYAYSPLVYQTFIPAASGGNK